MANNPLALGLHEALGFKVTRRIALETHQVGEEVHLVPPAAGAEPSGELSYVIELSIEEGQLATPAE